MGQLTHVASVADSFTMSASIWYYSRSADETGAVTFFQFGDPDSAAYSCSLSLAINGVDARIDFLIGTIDDGASFNVFGPGNVPDPGNPQLGSGSYTMSSVDFPKVGLLQEARYGLMA